MKDILTKWLEKLPKHTLAVMVIVLCTVLIRGTIKEWKRIELEKSKKVDERNEIVDKTLRLIVTNQYDDKKAIFRQLDSIEVNQRRNTECIKKNTRFIEVMSENYDKNTKKLFNEINKNYQDKINNIKDNSYMPNKSVDKLVFEPIEIILPAPVIVEKKNENLYGKN